VASEDAWSSGVRSSTTGVGAAVTARKSEAPRTTGTAGRSRRGPCAQAVGAAVLHGKIRRAGRVPLQAPRLRAAQHAGRLLYARVGPSVHRRRQAVAAWGRPRGAHSSISVVSSTFRADETPVVLYRPWTVSKTRDWPRYRARNEPLSTTSVAF